MIVGIKCKSDGLYYRAKVSEVRYNADRAGKFDGVVAQLLDTGRTGTFPFEEVVRFPARLAGNVVPKKGDRSSASKLNYIRPRYSVSTNHPGIVQILMNL